MSQFVVSARKYRPQRFDEVVGQEHVSLTLKNAIQQDQLAHAFLFCGPRGVGKTTCARILAKVLNCENRTDDFEACNTCSSCTSFNQNASFNIIELDAASNNSVEHIRALIEQVRFQPQQGQYKVFIIDEVHMLSSQAFNAFLKTLEEPPPYAIFILATTEKHKIIPTILSRCQIFDFKRIAIPRIVQHLAQICQQENIKADKEALHIIAQKADGALRDALSIFDRMSSSSKGIITYDSVIENLNILDYDYYFRVVSAILTEDVSQILLLFDEIFKKGFEPDIFINGLSEHLRNLLVCKDEKTVQLLDISEELKEQYFIQANMTPASLLLTALNIANDCDVHYKMARHKRLHVEIAIIKMTYIGRAITLAEDTSVPTPAIEKKKTNVSTASASSIKSGIEKSQVLNDQTLPTDSPKSQTENNSLPIVEDPAPPKIENKESVVTNGQPIAQAKNKTDRSPVTPTLGKSTKFDMPSLTNLTELEEEEDETTEQAAELELASLQAAWQAFIPQIHSPSVRESFKSVQLTIANSNSISLEVASQMSKQMIQQEKELLPFLRKTLRVPNLILTIQIDPEKAKGLVPTKKILSLKEKYELMRDKNPLIDELSRRFGLKPDN